MPGPLTWREVSAPDFRTAMDGMRFSTAALNDALAAGKSTLGDIQRQREDNTSNQVLAELAKYQSDPNKLIGDLSSGDFQSRFDAKSLTPEIMRTVMSKPAELLRFAGDKSAYDQSQLEIKDSNYLRENRDVFNQYLLTHRSKDPAAIAEFEAKHGDILKGASSAALRSFINNGQEITQGDLSSTGTRLNQLITGTNFKDDQEDRNMGFDIQQMKAGLATMEPGDRLRYMNQNRDVLSQTYGARAVSRLIGELDGSYSMPGIGGGGMGGGAGGAGFSGDYDSFVVALESNGNPNAKAGTSSATGLHQFTGDTWLETVAEAKPAWAANLSKDQILALRTDPTKSSEMEKVFRAKNAAALQAGGAPLSNENLYAAHHFGAGGGVKFANAAGNTPINQILTADQIAANPYLKGMTKDQVIANWNQRAGGVANPRALVAGGKAVTQANIAYSDGAVIDRTLNAAWQDMRSAREVAIELTGKEGHYAGSDVDQMTQKINTVARDHKLSPAVAAQVLRMSDNGKQSVFKRVFDPWSPFADGLSTDWDSDKIEQFAKRAGDRSALAKGAASLDQQVRTMAGAEQANAQVAQIEAAIAQKQQAALARTGSAANADISVELQLLAAARGTQGTAGRQLAAVATEGTPERPAKAAKPAAAPPKPNAGPARNQQNQAVQNLTRAHEAMLSGLGPNAGPTQKAAMDMEFTRRFGISIQQAKKDPAAALRAALAYKKKLDDQRSKATAAIAARVGNFSR